MRNWKEVGQSKVELVCDIFTVDRQMVKWIPQYVPFKDKITKTRYKIYTQTDWLNVFITSAQQVLTKSCQSG